MHDNILAELQAKGVSAETIIKISKALEAQETLFDLRQQARLRTKRWRRDVTVTYRDVTRNTSKINEAVTLRDVTNPPPKNPPLSDPQKPKRVSSDRARARRSLPDDWHPLIAIEDSAEFDRFRDYCRANGKLYADWDAAWRNWRTSPYRKPNGGHSNGRHKETLDEQCQRLADACRERERELDLGVFPTASNVGGRRSG